ncbi:MAG: hypothetical protein V7K92_25785 [Nostoc sp.]|uniref:hypothetical protein n=1 Tax=Nostoc sp. TaxID=1180 RepID=UPI002FF081E5
MPEANAPGIVRFSQISDGYGRSASAQSSRGLRLRINSADYLSANNARQPLGSQMQRFHLI